MLQFKVYKVIHEYQFEKKNSGYAGRKKLP